MPLFLAQHADLSLVPFLPLITLTMRRRDISPLVGCHGVTGGQVHVRVTGGTGTVDGRTRAYLESRLFNTLRSVARQIRRVDVLLSYGSADLSAGVTCTIVLDVTVGDQIVTTAAAHWPYAAIDSAVSEAWIRVRAQSPEAVAA